MHVCVCARVSLCGFLLKRRYPERLMVLGVLELEIWVAASHLTWVQGPKLWSSVRAVHILKH